MNPNSNAKTCLGAAVLVLIFCFVTQYSIDQIRRPDTARAQAPVGGAAGTGGGSGGGGSDPGNCLTSPGCISAPESSTYPTPTAGYDFLVGDSVTHGFLVSLNGGPLNYLAGSIANRIAATSSITTTETPLAVGVLPANSVQAGTAFVFRAYGICTSSVANAVTFRLRFGPNGDSTDTQIYSHALTANTTGSTVPWRYDADLVFRSTSQINAGGTFFNNGTTGASSTQTPLFGAPVTTSTLDTTVAEKIQISLITAAATTSCSAARATINLEHY
jgi:hypothetical protein